VFPVHKKSHKSSGSAMISHGRMTDSAEYAGKERTVFATFRANRLRTDSSDSQFAGMDERPYGTS
jgi:hypothetical protein